MARKLTYNTNNFSGGMTDKTRDLSDLSKSAFSSHFDIYSNPEELRVMPGYEADEAYDGSPTGMRQFKPRAFTVNANQKLWVAGEKAAGGGTKIFHKDFTTEALADGEWQVGTVSSATNSEATANLLARPRALIYGQDNVRSFALTENTGGTGKIVQIDAASTTNESYATFSGNLIRPTSFPIHQLGLGADSNQIWWNSGSGVMKDDGTTALIAKATSTNFSSTTFTNNVIAFCQSLRGMWYVVQKGNETCDLRLWDKQSTLDDVNIQLKNTKGAFVEEIGGTLTLVTNERLGETVELVADDTPITNGNVGFSVKVFDGYSLQTAYQQIVPSAIGSLALPLGQTYKGSMLFYVRHATDTGATTFREGIYALGRRSPDRPIALSMLFDMSSLGRFNSYFTFGNNHYFAHHSDWKISRLQRFDTGTYDVPATYETLFYGANTPFQKELDGVTIRSHALPSGATIELQYRTTPDGTWTSMGTVTSGKKHNFTRVGGVPIGKFQEIQFKLIATGKVVITNIDVGITETDDLPYKL
jgi:hypothetical protein